MIKNAVILSEHSESKDLTAQSHCSPSVRSLDYTRNDRTFDRQFFGMVMVSTIWLSVSRLSDTAEMPDSWIRARDWLR